MGYVDFLEGVCRTTLAMLLAGRQGGVEGRVGWREGSGGGPGRVAGRTEGLLMLGKVLSLYKGTICHLITTSWILC